MLTNAERERAWRGLDCPWLLRHAAQPTTHVTSANTAQAPGLAANSIFQIPSQRIQTERPTRRVYGLSALLLVLQHGACRLSRESPAAPVFQRAREQWAPYDQQWKEEASGGVRMCAISTHLDNGHNLRVACVLLHGARAVGCGGETQCHHHTIMAKSKQRQQGNSGSRATAGAVNIDHLGRG